MNAAHEEKALLGRDLGTGSASEIVLPVQDLRNRLDAREGLQEMLCNLEDTIDLLNL